MRRIGKGDMTSPESNFLSINRVVGNFFMGCMMSVKGVTLTIVDKKLLVGETSVRMAM